MKYWQLTSIFRDEMEIVLNEFRKDEWLFYNNIIANIEDIVKHQKRDLLDAHINETLLRTIAHNSNKHIYISKDGSMLYSYPNEDTDKAYSIGEAICLFEHDSIEEVFEKSSSLANFLVSKD